MILIKGKNIEAMKNEKSFVSFLEMKNDKDKKKVELLPHSLTLFLAQLFIFVTPEAEINDS